MELGVGERLPQLHLLGSPDHLGNRFNNLTTKKCEKNAHMDGLHQPEEVLGHRAAIVLRDELKLLGHIPVLLRYIHLSRCRC